MMQGWECPVCHVGVAPHLDVCPVCEKKHYDRGLAASAVGVDWRYSPETTHYNPIESGTLIIKRVAD